MRDWSAGDHVTWFILDAVESLDLEAFYASYRRGGWGCVAHDRQMTVALLVDAYAIGERGRTGSFLIAAIPISPARRR